MTERKRKRKRKAASETSAEDNLATLQRLMAEDDATFAELAAECPTRPHVACLYRWHHRGIRGVKLEAARFAGRYISSRQALARFLKATA